MADLRRAGPVAALVVTALLPFRVHAQSPSSPEDGQPDADPRVVREELERCRQDLDTLRAETAPQAIPPAAPPRLDLVGPDAVVPAAALQKEGVDVLRKQ